MALQRVRRPKRTGLRLRWKLAASLLALLVGLPLAMVAALSAVPPYTSAFMQHRLRQARAAGQRDFRIDYRWVPMEAIDPNAALAVMASEDQRFPLHAGFDTRELKAAIAARLRGRPLRGASTLSQQVAKNLFLWPDRSLLRKALEAYFTALIEMSWSKARTLEVYLNIAEFGDGVYGVEAASQRFFGHSASRLSASEAALLAAVLPAPKRYRADQPDARLRRKQRWIVSQMRILRAWDWLERVELQALR